MVKKRNAAKLTKLPDVVRISENGYISTFDEEGVKSLLSQIHKMREQLLKPVPMVLHCPQCNGRHIDEGEFATKHHHTHACQHCGFVWRPAIVPTVGVQFLPGFKNES
jgi:predicted RNA-binding Zn-ribbon protein involved in translation (DUF1610 family)